MRGRLLREGEGLGVGDADEQRPGEAGAGGDGDGVEIGEGDAGLGQRGADDGNDGAKVLAAGQLRHDAAVAGVGGDLRGDDGGKRARAALDDGRGGLVAGGFDAEDEAAGHDFSLVGGMRAASSESASQRVSEVSGPAERSGFARMGGRGENRSDDAGSGQFEAALRIVETLRAQGVRGVSRGRMRARSAAGARAG